MSTLHVNDSALFYLGKIPILTNILQTGEFNHHVVFVNGKFCAFSPGSRGGVLHMWILLRPCWVHFAGEAWKWRRLDFLVQKKVVPFAGSTIRTFLHGKSTLKIDRYCPLVM